MYILRNAACSFFSNEAAGARVGNFLHSDDECSRRGLVSNIFYAADDSILQQVNDCLLVHGWISRGSLERQRITIYFAKSRNSSRCQRCRQHHQRSAIPERRYFLIRRDNERVIFCRVAERRRLVLDSICVWRSHPFGICASRSFGINQKFQVVN